MTTSQRIDELVASLNQAVEDGLDYFTGPGKGSDVRIDLWTPREVLCHMIFWHQATLEGIESVASGGGPTRLYADTDEMNARAVGRAAGKNVDQLADQVRQLHSRLVEGVRKMPDPNATVLIRANGAQMSAIQRVEAISNHWREHLKEMQDE